VKLLPALVVVLVASPVLASVPLALDLEGCPQVPRAPVEKIVELELRASVVPEREAVTRVTASCDGDNASLRVDDPLTSKSLTRLVDLKAAGANGQARLLALSIIELVCSSWTELEASPPAGTATGSDAREALSAVRTLRGRRSVSVGALGVVRAIFSGTGTLGGAGLRIVPELPHHLALPIELAYERGTSAFDIGEVVSDVADVAVALAWRHDGKHLGLRLGGGLRGGAVHFSGRPSDPSVRGGSFWAPWVGPDLVVAGVWRPSRRLAFDLGLDGGWAFAPTAARVGGVNAVQLSGPFIGVALAIALTVGG
jgi:hypothetical protein